MCIPSASSAPLRAKWTHAEAQRAQRGKVNSPQPRHPEATHTVTLNLFQGLSRNKPRAGKAKWTLKQVQGDVGNQGDFVERAGSRRLAKPKQFQDHNGRHDTGPRLFAPHKKARTSAGPGHELDVRGRNIGRRRGVSGEERTPRRQALKLFTLVVQMKRKTGSHFFCCTPV